MGPYDLACKYIQIFAFWELSLKIEISIQHKSLDLLQIIVLFVSKFFFVNCVTKLYNVINGKILCPQNAFGKISTVVVKTKVQFAESITINSFLFLNEFYSFQYSTYFSISDLFSIIQLIQYILLSDVKISDPSNVLPIILVYIIEFWHAWLRNYYAYIISKKVSMFVFARSKTLIKLECFK